VKTAWTQRAKLRKALTDDGRPGLVIVRGDAFTTPYVIFIGRRVLGARGAHVEAGMRSGSLISPLPEEMNRRVATTWTDIHFAPHRERGEQPARRQGRPWWTQGPTPSSTPCAWPGTSHLRARTCRRNSVCPHCTGSNCCRAVTSTARLELLRGMSEQTPMPCLAGVHERERIESQQGLGENVVLTGMQTERLNEFLASYEVLRRPSSMDEYHPSESSPTPWRSSATADLPCATGPPAGAGGPFAQAPQPVTASAFRVAAPRKPSRPCC
jgi:hypothetical protein